MKDTYRAWIHKDKQMFYQKDQFLDSFFRRCNNLKGTQKVSYMRNSFHKDKNKKYIYEGDIVLVKTWLSLFKKKELVTFDKAAIRVMGEPVSNWADIEIIGNKYENPELLKEGKIKENSE